MTPAEIERLARMTCAIRPDWPLASMITGLRNFTEAHTNRSYPDTAHALLEIALDPKTQNPGRLAENGPWWHARPGHTETPRPVTTGPEAKFCRRPIATEDGQPAECNRLIFPGMEDEHQCRTIVDSPARAAAKASARQVVADAQGSLERAEGEAQQRREEASA